MPFYVISRPPTDDFTFRILYKALSNIDIPYDIDCFYAHSYHLENHYYQEKITRHPITKQQEYVDLNTGFNNMLFLEENIQNSKNNILLIIKDHLSGDRKHIDDPLWLIEYIRFLLLQNSNKKFILSTSLENLKQYFSESNISIVHHGGDIVNQYYDYKNLKPIFEKNFNSKKTSISLNRNFRFQRLIFLALLLDLNFEKNFYLSCMFKEQLKKFDVLNNFKKFKYIDNLIRGTNKIKTYKFKSDSINDIYDNRPNDNSYNFITNLSKLYKNSFIEIALETTFLEDCFLITEKTSNVFLGCNFPIILNSKNSINFLRQLGFDMFDDIINHSYDVVDDPVERVYKALTDNKDVLTNSSLIKNLWKSNIKRFEHNVYVAQNKIYDFYKNRFIKEITNTLR